MNKILLITGIALIIGSMFLSQQSQDNSISISKEQVSKFSKFQKTFNKKYSTLAEENFRLAVFHSNMNKAERNNADSTSTFTMGQTQFSDLTQEEFVAQYLTLKIEDLKNIDDTTDIYEDLDFVSDGPVDWRSQPGVATHVKNQGACGACWAFSAVGAIEALYATTKGQKDLDLSEQQVVHCAKNGNSGCLGGLPSAALKWISENGLVTQEEYPYSGLDGNCSSNTGSFHIDGSQRVAVDENSLKSAVKLRPVSVCIDASTWSQYTGGILNNCGTALSNHAVLAFGYGEGYWLIKNQWGNGWGESGFIKIKDGNTCNILSWTYLAV